MARKQELKSVSRILIEGIMQLEREASVPETKESRYMVLHDLYQTDDGKRQISELYSTLKFRKESAQAQAKKSKLFGLFFSYHHGGHFNSIATSPEKVMANLQQHADTAQDFKMKIPKITLNRVQKLAKGKDIWTEFEDGSWVTVTCLSEYSTEQLAIYFANA